MFGKKADKYKYYSQDGANSSSGQGSERDFIGSSLNFASREAYKQLRTNLDFSLTDIEGCRCIGMTSPTRSDGKSLTAVNLGYALAEDGYKVILIECDMRIPSLGKKLGVNHNTGLTSLLSGSSDIASFEPLCLLEGTTGFFDLLLAGEVPPNPQELLGSVKMADFVRTLRNTYDYILLDLPPVTAVADALVASRIVDGMMLVVRQDHTERGMLAESIRQLEFADVKILGFVFNAANNDDDAYSRRYKYKYRYYKGYRNGYGYGYYKSGYRSGDYGNYYRNDYRSDYRSGHIENKGSADDRYTHTPDSGN